MNYADEIAALEPVLDEMDAALAAGEPGDPGYARLQHDRRALAIHIALLHDLQAQQ